MSNYQGEIEHIKIDLAAATGSTIRSAVTGCRIIPLAYKLNNAQATGMKFQSGTDDLAGYIRVAAKSQVDGPENSNGHVKTAAGASLRLRLSTATTIAGHMTIQIVP